MDRVLILMDDLQGATHLEMTLRKVGFDVEIITNEFHLSEKLLSFNPDYILVKGSGARISTLSVGKKLKESLKYNGKVILVFGQNNKPSPDDLIQIRMDLLLFEPVSAIKLVAQLLLMTTANKELIVDKLMRLANTDQQFRQAEIQLLAGSSSIENEIQMIVSKLKSPAAENVQITNEKIEDNDIFSFINPELANQKKSETKSDPFELQIDLPLEARGSDHNPPEKLPVPTDTSVVSDEYKNSLIAELIQAENELMLKIESYKKETDAINIDTTVGLNKKATRKANRELFGSLASDEMLRLKRLDKEKQEFARALFSEDTDFFAKEVTSDIAAQEMETSQADLEADLAALEAELELANKQKSDG